MCSGSTFANAVASTMRAKRITVEVSRMPRAGGHSADGRYARTVGTAQRTTAAAMRATEAA